MGPDTLTAVAACIETSHGFIPTGIKRSVIEELRAVVARDADVRTLDDWARDKGRAVTPHPFLPTPDGPYRVFGIKGVTGATPDEARAKAAAWVREQAKSAEGSKADGE